MSDTIRLVRCSLEILGKSQGISPGFDKHLFVYTYTNHSRHSGNNDQPSKAAPHTSAKSLAPKEDKNHLTLPVPAVNPAPMVLMIQTELCEKHTLKTWLLNHIHNRDKKTVLGFFDQVLTM